MDNYYETLGLIYECYDEGYISEDTKDTLKEKLKEARDKAEEKLSKAKEFAKKHKKALAAAGTVGALAVSNKLDKDMRRHYNKDRIYEDLNSEMQINKDTLKKKYNDIANMLSEYQDHMRSKGYSNADIDTDPTYRKLVKELKTARHMANRAEASSVRAANIKRKY